MKKSIIYSLQLVLALALTPWVALAQPSPNPPGQISYQGFLTDATGIPLATNTPKNFNVIFRIYDASTGGSEKWAEQQVVTVDRGYFTVMLGNGSSVDGNFTNNLSGVFSGPTASDRYLEMTVQGLTPSDPPIAPRLRLLASPYAFLAQNAVKLVSASGSDLITSSGSTVTVSGVANVAGTMTASNFVGFGTIPIGGIIMWSGNTVPAGWALCDGQNGTPNLANRFVRGAASGLGPYVTGGSDTHTHTSPPHSHVVDPPNTTTAANAGKTTVNGFNGGTDVASLGHAHNVNIPPFDSASTNVVIDVATNIPAYYALAFIMRVQ